MPERCIRCWSILPSDPANKARCVCGNVCIDLDAGRAGAWHKQLLRVLQIADSDQFHAQLHPH